MPQLILDMPLMYADHHVLKVREALAGVAGLTEVYASSAWKQVLVTYDEAQVGPQDIEQALAAAGYPPGPASLPVLVEANNIKRDPHWETLGVRVTRTNEADVTMSGEFRRY